MTRTKLAAVLAAACASLPAVAQAAPPKRIVSLSPTATEDLFAIGAGRQVIAVDDQSNYPKAAPRTKLSGFTPNIEAIVGYKPDLVVLSNDPKGALASKLRTFKVRVLLQPAARNLGDTYRQIRALGAATGHSRQATAVVRRMQAQVSAIVASVPKRATPLRVYHELDPKDLYSASSASFVGSIYARLGLANIADSAPDAAGGYPKLSAEGIIGASPDLIVLADTKCCGQTPRTVTARPGWGSVAAVTAGNIVPVDDDVASRWGPRVVTFMRTIADRVAAIR